MENVKEWVENNGFGHGSGDSYSFGYGEDTSSVYGDGDGSGFGYGRGSGYGRGRGSGYGRGRGSGYGSGSGSGRGFGRGLREYNKMVVYSIDGIQTILTHVKDNFATGYILNGDFTLSPCVVAKGNGYFAHGKTFHEAREVLRSKIFENMNVEDAINEFIKTFDKGETYSGTEFFEWHHYLTGSCLMGRESFVKNHGLDLSNEYTVTEFIAICENDYGGEIIKRLKEFYK